jgi:hypothetical protein
VRKKAKTRSTPKKPSKRREKTFSTLHEVNIHFFPERDERIVEVKGDKRGADVATRAFEGITTSALG